VFFKEGRKERGRERRRRRKRGTSFPLKTDASHFGPCDLRGTNTLLDKYILFRPLIGTLCRKALKVHIDLIINWY
jgi:hypothetical protein